MYVQSSVYISISLLLLTRGGHCCIFTTLNGFKISDKYVTKIPNITRYNDDCAFLCYKDRDACVAANVIRQSDDSHLCQFVSVSVTSDHVYMMEDNPAGKYFSRTGVQGNTISQIVYVCHVVYVISDASKC